MGALNTLSAMEAARRIAAGKLSAEALVRDCLERIAARESEVQAWEYLDQDAAIRQARAADAAPPRGLLHGVPIGVKDLIDTIDMPTAYGSPVYAAHRPAWDAPCVALTRAAGGIVLGKTVTTEFANMHPGKTRNPHNPAHTPGGSSSGSAAAVADYMVPLAFGTQTAGSIIRPSSYCGVVGYKPSFGLINRVGVKALSDTLDTVGVIARSVPDAAYFAAAVSGRRELIVDRPFAGRLRIGICRTFEWKHALPETIAALESAARRLGAAGAAVSEIKLPPTYASLVQAQTDIMFVEEAQSLAFERLAHASSLSGNLRGLLDAGLAVPPERYDAAQTLARNCRRTLADVFADCDVLLAPSAPGAAPAGLTMTGDPVFNRMWTLLRTPCVTLPVATAGNGLPVGLQVIGAFGSDVETLAGAHWVHLALKQGAG
jgi:Asp-tRNA(Asn)/Glu-tRNA(Gln) amidotransferase A subunit family amidase